MTFKSILFGELIRLRLLNQTKEDYFSNINPLRENAIALASFGHDI